jgi:protease I
MEKCMAKIAVIIAEDFEDSEYSKPAEAFQIAGHKLTHIGLSRGVTVHGEQNSASAKIDKSFSDVDPSEFDALFIPGGYSPDRLRADSSAVSFVEKFVKSNKPVFAICHAPQILITAGVLKGRTVTGWKSIVQDIKNAGAKFVDMEVVKDGNLISSRNPHDIPVFIDTCLRMLDEVSSIR